MPRKAIIKQHTATKSTQYWTTRNAMSALAEAIGSEVVGSENTLTVSLDSVGYNNLEVVMDGVPKSDNPTSGSWQANRVSIRNKSNNFYLSEGWINWDQGLKNNSISCCVTRDPNNDTVIMGMHLGIDTWPATTDVNAVPSGICCLFVGRDVKDNVIYGIGCCHINRISNGFKTIDTFKYANRSLISDMALPMAGGPSDFIHLVKMVNYLDDEYPEMKTAYVAVARGDTTAPEKGMRSHISYYANGAMWGTGGSDYPFNQGFDGDPIPTNPTSNKGSAFYKAIDPWVKY